MVGHWHCSSLCHIIRHSWCCGWVLEVMFWEFLQPVIAWEHAGLDSMAQEAPSSLVFPVWKGLFPYPPIPFPGPFTLALLMEHQSQLLFFLESFLLLLLSISLLMTIGCSYSSIIWFIFKYLPSFFLLKLGPEYTWVPSPSSLHDKIFKRNFQRYLGIFENLTHRLQDVYGAFQTNEEVLNINTKAI